MRGLGENSHPEYKYGGFKETKDSIVALWNASMDRETKKLQCKSRREKLMEKKEKEEKEKEEKEKEEKEKEEKEKEGKVNPEEAKGSTEEVDSPTMGEGRKRMSPYSGPQDEITMTQKKRNLRTGRRSTIKLKENMRTSFMNYVANASKLESEERVNAFADLFVMMIQVRDCRQGNIGKGARYPSWRLFVHLAKLFPQTAIACLKFFPRFGYWKDLNELLIAIHGNPDPVFRKAENEIYQLYANALKEDLEKETDNTGAPMTETKEKTDCIIATKQKKKRAELSLAAKWVPKRKKSCDRQTNASLAIARRLFSDIIPPEQLELSDDEKQALSAKYIRVVSALNKALETTEIKMSSGRYSEIVFGKIPGRCLNRNKNIFLDIVPYKNIRGHEGNADRDKCVENYNKFLEDLKEKKTKKGASKGTSVNVHKLVKSALSTPTEETKILLEAQWGDHEDALREVIAGGRKSLGAGLVLADVSGSMEGDPMCLAIALAILVSRAAEEPWKERFISFHSEPQFFDISPYKGFCEAVNFIKGTKWGGSTDIHKVFDLILNMAKENKMHQEQLPEFLMIVSDMQFNQAHRNFEVNKDNSKWNTAHEIIVERFAEVGKEVTGKPYVPPRMIYWNARGDVKGFPVVDEEGAQMVSGCSASLIKLFLQEGNLDKAEGPYDTVRKALDQSVYDEIRNAVKEIGEVSSFQVTEVPGKNDHVSFLRSTPLEAISG